MRRAFADAGVDLIGAGIRQVRRVDLEHFGPVLGERAGAGRPGEHAREIEHAHACQRPRAGRQRLRRRIADAQDFEQGLRPDGGRVRMLRPFARAARESGAASGGVDRVLQFESVPVRACAHCRLAFVRGAQHFHRGVAMMGKIAVDADPAAVAHRVKAAQRIARPVRRFAVDLQIARAAQRSGRRAGIDGDRLPPSRAQAPQFRRRIAGRRDGGRPRCGDPIGRRKHRIVPGDPDLPGLRRGQPGQCYQFAQGVLRHERIPRIDLPQVHIPSRRGRNSDSPGQ